MVVFSAQGNPIGGMSGPYITTFALTSRLQQYPLLIEHNQQFLYLGVVINSEVCEVITETRGDEIELGLLLPVLKFPPNEVMLYIEARLASLERWDESFTSEVLIAVGDLYEYEAFCSLCR